LTDYVKSTNFAIKDGLASGNAAKVVKGTEIDVEFNNIASAISSKLDASNPTISGNITVTGNVTTNALVVGTQAGKATLNYSTNAARTLTVPAVAGNRTFAFIDEAQTFTTNQTIDANLVFTNSQRRLQAPFNSQTSNAFLLQNSGTNLGTSVGVIPNGTSKESSLILYSSTDPANSNYLVLYASDSQTRLDSDSVGTGTTQRIRLDTDNFERITIAPTGEVSINTSTASNTALKIAADGRTYSLQADNKILFNDTYGNTVGATNRTLYIDNGGVLGGLSSTRESKTNITPITDTDWIMSLEPVSYNRKLKNNDDTYSDVASPNTEFGLIADDVANVRPEVCVFVDGKVSGINYEQLISPMLKEIQKLRAEVESLKEKVNV
jgi:hypothetical protein